jgi:hypothetical protein
MRKYLSALLLGCVCLLLPACDSTDVRDTLRLVEIQYAVVGHSGFFATEASIAYTDADGSIAVLVERPLPFQRTLRIQAGSTVTLNAAVTAPNERSGVRILIWSAGEIVAQNAVSGAAGAEIVSRNLAVSYTVR